MISRALCEEVLAAAASTGADYAELFAEKTFNRSVSMLDSRVQQSNDNVVAGVGIRVFKGLRSVAASTVDTSREGLLRCAGQAAAALGEDPADAVFICGGASIYELFFEDCDAFYVTRIDEVFDADRFFPNLEEKGFVVTWESEVQTDEATGIQYTFRKYERCLK